MQRQRRCRGPQRNTIATRTTFAFISVHSRFINRHLPFTTHDFSLRHSKFLVRHSSPSSHPPCPSNLRAAVRKKNCISCANPLSPRRRLVPRNRPSRGRVKYSHTLRKSIAIQRTATKFPEDLWESRAFRPGERQCGWRTVAMQRNRTPTSPQGPPGGNVGNPRVTPNTIGDPGTG
jgi:hypothetical protein